MPGLNNWFETTLAPNEQNCQKQFEVKFNFDIKELDLNFETASDTTANLIANRYENLHLCLSGGLDSEYVASVLVRNKIEFTPVIVITNGISVLESWWAFDFCKKHNIEPLVFDYQENIDDLVKLMLKHSLKFNLPFNNGLIPCAVASKVSGPVLTGFGDLVPMSKNYQEPIGDVVEGLECDYYLDLLGDQHPSGFFAYTPSMCFSLLASLDRNDNSQSAKSRLYGVGFRAKIPSPSIPNIPSQLVPLVEKNKKIDQLRWAYWSYEELSQTFYS